LALYEPPGGLWWDIGLQSGGRGPPGFVKFEQGLLDLVIVQWFRHDKLWPVIGRVVDQGTNRMSLQQDVGGW
jgi:hypothetical protein